MALIEARALLAGMDTQITERFVYLRRVPDFLKAAGTEIARFKAVALQKSTGIHMTGRADAAGQLGGAAEVEPQTLTLLCGQREKAVAGAHVAAFCEPVGESEQLCRGRPE